MKIRWYGHACFALENEEGKVLLTDPYDPQVGYGELRVKCDVVCISHHHHDHDCLDYLDGAPEIIDGTVRTELCGFSIDSILSAHDDADGKKRGSNIIRSFTADGKRIVHLGDLGHIPNDGQYEFIKGADVLLVPIGGFYTIDTQTAIKIIKTSAPKCVIPMHYRNEACSFPISTAEEFKMALHPIEAKSLEMDAADLTGAVIMSYR